MLYANSLSGNQKLSPTSGKIGKCPICSSEVVAKYTKQNNWQWQHTRSSSHKCLNWKNKESKWTSFWKSIFPFEQREVLVSKNGFNQIADIQLPGGLSIEFQKEGLKGKEIIQRESFFDHLIWMFDASKAYQAKRLRVKRDFYNSKSVTFSWEAPRISLKNCNQPIFLDLGFNKILRIMPNFESTIQYDNTTGSFLRIIWSGTGFIMDKADFKKLVQRFDQVILQRDALRGKTSFSESNSEKTSTVSRKENFDSSKSSSFIPEAINETKPILNHTPTQLSLF